MTVSKSQYAIAVIPGDGIGPEIVEAACTVLTAVAEMGDFGVNLVWYEAGAGAFQSYGDPLPPETLAQCRQADAIFKGPTGLPEVRLPEVRMCKDGEISVLMRNYQPVERMLELLVDSRTPVPELVG